MDSGNEVIVDDEINVKKEGTVDETNSSKVEVNESSESVSETGGKSSMKSVTNGDTSKKNKLAKNGPSTSVVQNPRVKLSQSSSFSAKTRIQDGQAVRPRVGSKGDSALTNETGTSDLHSASRRSSGGVKVVESSAKSSGAGARRATLDSVPSASKPRAKITNGDEDHPPSKDLQRRNSVTGFSFRLDERAEKRRQFFSKLEEKSQAKEVEKTNLQEKSKESQEAEIKKFRKSLTFKAAPLPSFYKEPPPKVELKKMPTTRPKSPKLGRNKSSMASVNRSVDQTVTVVSPRVRDQPTSSVVNLKKDTAASKKPIRKQETKTPPSKTKVKPEKSTETPAKVEDQEKEQNSDEQFQEIQVPPVNPLEPAKLEDQEKEHDSDEQFQEIQAPPVNPLEVDGWIEVSPQKNAVAEESTNRGTVPGDIVVVRG